MSVLLTLAAAGLVWLLVSPRSVWERTVAWRYENPDAHRPSQEAYAMHRFGAVVGLLLVAVVAGLAAG